MPTVADEKKRAMTSYVVATYPEYADNSINDIEIRYYEMKIGAGVNTGLSLSTLQRTYWNAGSLSIDDAERKHYLETVGTGSMSLPDLELAYWSAQP